MCEELRRRFMRLEMGGEHAVRLATDILSLKASTPIKYAWTDRNGVTREHDSVVVLQHKGLCVVVDNSGFVYRPFPDHPCGLVWRKTGALERYADARRSDDQRNDQIRMYMDQLNAEYDDGNKRLHRYEQTGEIDGGDRWWLETLVPQEPGPFWKYSILKFERVREVLQPLSRVDMPVQGVVTPLDISQLQSDLSALQDQISDIRATRTDATTVSRITQTDPAPLDTEQIDLFDPELAKREPILPPDVASARAREMLAASRARRGAARHGAARAAGRMRFEDLGLVDSDSD